MEVQSGSLYKTKIALISEEDRGEVKTTLYHPNSAAEAASAVSNKT